MMKKRNTLRFLTLLMSCLSILNSYASNKFSDDVLSYINPLLGTSTGYANLLPVASVPFGMVQLGADTHLNNSGYKYDATEIIGFSHTHMSGGGCSEYKDIMFLPQSNPDWSKSPVFPDRLAEPFSHDKELTQPGYYSVDLLKSNIQVELTATERCGMHRYTYAENNPQQLIIDLKHGHNKGCTVCPGYNFDTVRVAGIEVLDERTIKGYRISDGWLNGVRVNFYAEFSRPFKSVQLYSDKKLVKNVNKFTGTDLRLLIEFDESKSNELVARVGISPVDTDGAMKNLTAEIKTWSFDAIKEQAQNNRVNELMAIQIPDDSPQKSLFYTMLYRTLFYPQIYSDIDGRFRGSGNEVHKADFTYFGGTLSLWDTFRAQNPLIALLRPDIVNDLMKTFIEHYKYFGQLPQWTGAGVENWCMIGLPAHSIIADSYYKGIRDFDVDKLYEAMVVSVVHSLPNGQVLPTA